MKKTPAVLLALLVLALAWTTWRVSALSEEVDYLARRPEPAPAPAPDLARARTVEAPALATLSVPATPAQDRGVGDRLAALEKRLEAFGAKWADMEEARKEVAAFLAELFAARAGANETAAVATSRNAISAQAQFQMTARADSDSDGTGEYGGFLEMSGAEPGRMPSRLAPPVLSQTFQKLTPAGEVVRAGYVYRVYLPDARGVGVGEPQTGFTRGIVDANLSETTWCMYAWPVAYGKSGTRTFFTNQEGDVLATDSSAYGGTGAGPSADAAYVERGLIMGRVAVSAKGSDGNVWKQVN